MDLARIQTIHQYWFGDLDDNLGQVDAALQQSWFNKNPARDQDIKQLFEADIHAAIRGDNHDWADTPRGRMALILLIDQFCRQVYRDTPDAFKHDPIAEQWTTEGIKAGLDLELTHIERVFFYLPLEHSESKEIQALSNQKYTELFETADEPERDTYREFLNYALAHQRIIDRFGRFPHRNEILGRQSTAEEIEFLKQPGSSF